MMSELDKFLKGEWEDCQTVCKALRITFLEGLRLFEFSRTAVWNPAPLNGQKITTQFRIRPSKVGTFKPGMRVRSIKDDEQKQPPYGFEGVVLAITDDIENGWRQRVLVRWLQGWHDECGFPVAYQGKPSPHTYYCYTDGLEVAE